jgi:hypothetical protein
MEDDERTEVFKYSLIYNDITFGKEKSKVQQKKKEVVLNNLVNIGALFIIFALTVAYFLINGKYLDLLVK